MADPQGRGFVIAQFAKGAVSDPDIAVPETGAQVRFTPDRKTMTVLDKPLGALAGPPVVVCTIGPNGYLLSPDGTPGVWLVVGNYTVAFDVPGKPLGFPITVTTDHTVATPLDLQDPLFVPPDGAPVVTMLVPPVDPDVEGFSLTVVNQRLAWQAVTGGGGGSVTWANITGKPAVIAEGATQAEARAAIGAGTGNGTSTFSGQYGDLGGVPATFPPAAHSHTVGDVTGLQAVLDGKQPAGSYATAAQGALADSAVQPAALSGFISSSTIQRFEEITRAAYDDPGFTPVPGTAYLILTPAGP